MKKLLFALIGFALICSQAWAGPPSLPGSLSAASTAEVAAGTVENKYVNPKELKTVSDGKASSTAPVVLTAAGLTQDKVYYMASNGSWTQADANGTGTYPARCYAISTAQCLISGSYTKSSHGLTVGATMYLSDSAGDVSTTASTTTVQSLGWVLDANTLVINVSNDYGQP